MKMRNAMMPGMVLLLLMAALSARAQTHFLVDFSDGFPPAGWTIEGHESNWSSEVSANAGGSSPEARFSWSPQFNGVTRLISPVFDLTGNLALTVDFRHFVNHYSGNYTLGVATRSGGSDWHDVWTLHPNGDVGPEQVFVSMGNEDISAADFQICWYFSGNSYNIDYWYLDDLHLYTPYMDDVAVTAILLENQYAAGETVVPQAVVRNVGLNIENFSVSCACYNSAGEELFSGESEVTGFMPSTETTVVFPELVLPTENELYRFTVTTLLETDMDSTNDRQDKFVNTYTTPRDQVILEIGTGTWCTYCPGAAMGAEDLVDNGHPVGVVEYHSGDNFENATALARINYYGISGFPTAVFDGLEKYVGGSHDQSLYNAYLPLVEARQGVNTPCTIAVYGEAEGLDYHLAVHIQRMAPVADVPMFLQVALTESDIFINWQGQNHVDFVERMLIPGPEGTPVSLLDQEEVTVELDFALDPTWIAGNCELVAFLQNGDTKEILQGTKVALGELTPDAVVADSRLPETPLLLGNYPNPFNPETRIDYFLAGSGSVELAVYDLRGRRVALLVDGFQAAGAHSVLWRPGTQLAAGLYFQRLRVENTLLERKMLLVK